MIFGLDKKFRPYVCARYVSPDIPDDLLEELKAFNAELKKRTGKDYFDFPR